ncbi:MAG: VOC family protein, partial [Planctomycetota bacterium]
MKEPPSDWPRISSALFYEDAAKAIDWLCRAFGFEVRLKIEGDGGRIEHSELVLGGGLIMVGTAGGSPPRPER